MGWILARMNYGRCDGNSVLKPEALVAAKRCTTAARWQQVVGALLSLGFLFQFGQIRTRTASGISLSSLN